VTRFHQAARQWASFAGQQWYYYAITQSFAEDFDGYLPSAPVYDYSGRNAIAAAWWAQAVDDGHGGSVLNSEAAQMTHKSVVDNCGAQAGVEKG
jgi:hypothetical protein